MPRRKRAAAEEEAGAVKKNKKESRVGLTVRIKSKPVIKRAAPKLEPRHQAVMAESDQLMQRAVTEELTQAPEAVQEISREIELIRLEREKRLLMWVGVSFFMLVVMVGWIFSMKLMFSEQEQKIAQSNNLDIDEISAKFNQTMQDVSEGLSKFNDLATSTLVIASSTSAAALPDTALQATSSVKAAQASSTASFEESLEIKILEAKLEELKKRINANAANASSTKESSINR